MNIGDYMPKTLLAQLRKPDLLTIIKYVFLYPHRSQQKMTRGWHCKPRVKARINRICILFHITHLLQKQLDNYVQIWYNITYEKKLLHPQQQNI